MQNTDIHDALFREAVEAIDSGELASLQRLLQQHPLLVAKRLDTPAEGYFAHPYLLWFIADNPIRHGKLPPNIVDITALLIDYVERYAQETARQQLDYAAGLVETGRVPRECGVQIPLLDLFLAHGVPPGTGQGALANGNIAAAKHLIEKSGRITLAAAACLHRMDDVKRLLPEARAEEKQVALIAAAFYGDAEMVNVLLAAGADVNAYIDRGFHTHATALHQAVWSGSLETVRLLTEAGADLDATDRVYHGTPLGWVMHMQAEEQDAEKRERYKEMERYLRSLRP
jgi:peptide-methionine (S)-S-oxide reductase